jgi:hypothetical protein
MPRFSSRHFLIKSCSCSQNTYKQIINSPTSFLRFPDFQPAASGVILIQKKVHQKTIQRIKIMKAKIILGLILSTAAALNSFAQYTAYANIYATVVAPIEIITTLEEHSGEIVVSQKGTSISSSAQNTITASGIALTSNGIASIATFSVSDQKNSTFDITLPSENLIFATDMASILTVSNFSSNKTKGAAINDKTQVITVGASISFPENQIVSNNSPQNQFPITLNYN